jgi:hypothetical protein
MSKASNPVLDMNSILSPSRTLLLSCCLLLASLLPLSAYAQNSAQPKQAPQQNTAVSEDVQRFLGFEKPVLFRYLSVPYDVSMTRNVNLYTIDIGFFLLLLVPLALFLAPRRHGWSLLLSLLLLLLFLIISVGSAYLEVEQSPQAGLEKLSGAMASPGFGEAPLETSREVISYACLLAYQPLYSMASAVSGEKDAVTYPLLILLLIGGLALLAYRYRGASPSQQALLLFTMVYGFLWWILSPGLNWYGYLLFAVLPLLATYAWAQKRQEGLFPFGLQRGIFYGLVGVWLFSAFCLRMANNGVAASDGKDIFYPPTAAYRMGKFNERQVLQSYRPGYPEAAAYLNQETQSRIYQAGTQLGFFIQKNDKRCLKDTFLEFAKQLLNTFPNKREMIKAMKASGFRYLIIDLALPQSDQTPDKSLSKKFQDFMNVLYQNPEVELLVTDREIQLKGSGKIVPGVFLNRGQVVKAGSFALYRIK